MICFFLCIISSCVIPRRLTGGWSDSHGRNRWMHVRGIRGGSLPAWEIYGARLPRWRTLETSTVTSQLPYRDQRENERDVGHSDSDRKFAQLPHTQEEAAFCFSRGRQRSGLILFLGRGSAPGLNYVRVWENMPQCHDVNSEETQSCTQQQETSLTKV